MANLTSYLRWRGDIPLTSQPFGDIDNLLFSALAYLDFEGIIPPASESETYQRTEAAWEANGSHRPDKAKANVNANAPATIAAAQDAVLESQANVAAVRADVDADQTNSSEAIPAGDSTEANQTLGAATADQTFGTATAAPQETAFASQTNAPEPTIARTAAAFSDAIASSGRMAKKTITRTPGPTISLLEAARAYTENIETRKTPAISLRYTELVETLVDCRRYETVRVGSLASVSSADKPLQFVAMTFYLPDGSRYVAFRGTGDEIEDWRQDFMISFTQTSAQALSVRYLRERMRESPSAPFYVGGHSKGGNLALYSVMCTPSMSAARIKTIYSNDGPGICPELRTEGYDRAVQKLVRIIPEFSIIGMLFEAEVEPIIVKSDDKGIMQHDAMTWQITGNTFNTAAALSKESVGYNHILSGWIESASMDERAAFTRDFFDALKGGGAVNVQDIAGNGINGFGTILASLATSEKATHIAFRKFFESVFSHIRQIKLKDLVTSQLGITGFAVIALGFIFLILPRAGTHVVGYTLLGIGTLLLLRKILRTAVANHDKRIKKFFILIELLVLMLQVFVLSTPALMTIIENILIGVCFLTLAISLLRHTVRIRTRSQKAEQIIGYLFSGIFAAVGIYTIAMPSLINEVRSIAVGAALIVAGILILGVGAYREAKKRA